jgi:hypothetical protein
MLDKIANWLLAINGWTVIGQLPPEPKVVVLAAPHTSNWDGVVAVLAKLVLKAPLKWLVKDSLYETPLKPILKWSGAVPITRKGNQNVVDQVVAMFAEYDHLLLGLAPEGTRKRTEGWRSGFYYIALEAKVPIYFGFFDYKKKEVGLGGSFMPTGDIEADMQIVKAFYETKTAKFPENVGEIKLLPRRTNAPAAT